jgi:dephospho-CoA kinase
MKRIGLTGGVGMGKSTAAGFLLARGFPLVDTDATARALVQPGQPALTEITATFGPKILTAAGELNRPALARIVFNDSAARQRLEAILHPRIRQHWQEQLARWAREGQALAVVVIPLLFETAAETEFDEVVCVACRPVTQQQRLLARGWSPEECRQRIAAQLPVEQKLARARRVLWTEGTLAAHEAQVARLCALWR